jgi:hypothetical protein
VTHAHRLITVLMFLAVLATGAARGAVEMSDPLGNHYRAGRYIPVHVVARDEISAQTEIPGTVPATVGRPASGLLDAILPVLVVKPVEALGEDERLIGSTVPDTQVASQLFPEKKLFHVGLDLANPLPGPALAWNTLDAVLLDAASAARVTEKQLETLLASGTTVAVKSELRPGAAWNWKRLGEWWVVRPPQDGSIELIQPERYADFSSASVGWPSPVRWSLFLTLLAFSLLAVAVSLLRWRKSWMAVIFLSVFTVAAVMLWRKAQRPMIQTTTMFSVGPWQETLTHYASMADGEFRHPIDADDALTLPVFWSRRQLEDVKLVLECNPDGTPIAFVGKLNRDQSIVFISRSLAIKPTPAPATTTAIQPR